LLGAISLTTLLFVCIAALGMSRQEHFERTAVTAKRFHSLLLELLTAAFKSRSSERA